MPIDIGQAGQFYAAGTAANVGKWSAKAAAKAGEWERAAKSPQAESNYAAGVELAARNQLRLRGLQDVSAGQWGQAVQGAGEVYRIKTAAASGKWQAKFAPYAPIIDRTVAALPAKMPGQARQNTINRCAPIGEALQQAKLAGVRTAPIAQAPIGYGARAPAGYGRY